MKVTFFSNFLNHHQLPFCLEMQKHLGDNFKFVATEEIPKERLDLGYDDMNKAYDFVVRSYETEKDAYKLGLESDVVIIGSAPVKYIKERLKQKKLTFRYSERIFKNGFNFRTWLALIKNYTILERNNVYLLCSSAYAAYDFNIAGAYINKCYKWGYFPEVIKYDLEKLLKKKNDNKKLEILWVGRVIEYKHPEKAVLVAKKLKENNIDFAMKIIGVGDLYNKISNLIKEYNLEKEVHLIGAVNNKDVRKYMEKANIFLFTSDYGEGWGAVLNEAMNSACAVVASHAIGSVPYLIMPNKNGIIYNDSNNEDLLEKFCELVKNRNKMELLGKNAYETMIKYWNAEYAAKNFLQLADSLLNNKEKKNIVEIGPCSKALSISNKKMYNYLVECNCDK